MQPLQPLLISLAQMLSSQKETLATAESCTGGGLAALLTRTAGASLWYKSGVIAYSEEVKSNLLGISPDLIKEKGVVSAEVALAMAQGVQTLLEVNNAIATTGYAGPSGGTPKEPIGTVYIGFVMGTQKYSFRVQRIMPRELWIKYICQEALRLFFLHYKNLRIKD